MGWVTHLTFVDLMGGKDAGIRGISLAGTWHVFVRHTILLLAGMEWNGFLSACVFVG
jgi:hypothetical protein